MNEKLKKITKLTKALSDDTRIRIVNLLSRKEKLCVCEINEIIGLSQPTISSHLKILENANILVFKKEGLWVEYMLNPAMEKYQKDMIETISKNIAEDEIIQMDLESSMTVDREEITKNKKFRK
jgi:ArsR family transcriptional regulator, arsenate/arsenite/antimonite-responsive transcriptional repressor